MYLLGGCLVTRVCRVWSLRKLKLHRGNLLIPPVLGSWLLVVVCRCSMLQLPWKLFKAGYGMIQFIQNSSSIKETQTRILFAYFFIWTVFSVQTFRNTWRCLNIISSFGSLMSHSNRVQYGIIVPFGFVKWCHLYGGYSESQRAKLFLNCDKVKEQFWVSIKHGMLQLIITWIELERISSITFDGRVGKFKMQHYRPIYTILKHIQFIFSLTLQPYFLQLICMRQFHGAIPHASKELEKMHIYTYIHTRGQFKLFIN